MSKSTTRLLAFAALGAAGWYFFLRKPANANPTLTITIPGQSGQGTITLANACKAAVTLKAQGDPNWQAWADICTQNGGTAYLGAWK